MNGENMQVSKIESGILRNIDVLKISENSGKDPWWNNII